MLRPSLCAAVLLLVSACAHPHAAVIPIDPAHWDEDFQFQFAVYRLDGADRLLLTAWLSYAQLTWPRGMRIRPGTTIAQAVHAQRDFQQEEHQRRLREKQVGHLLPIITSRPVLYRLSPPSHGSL